MKDKKSYKISEILESEVISVAYNDASLPVRLKIFFLRKKYQEVNKLFNEYRKTYKSIQSVKKPVIPEELSRSITEISRSDKGSILEALYITYFRKPVFYAAFMVLIAFFLMKTPFTGQPDFTLQERKQIENANEKVMMSLAIVNKAFNSTKVTLEKDILADKVGRPIKNSLKIVNNLFTEE